MGNLPSSKFDSQKFSEEENYIQIFSKDPSFETYYLSNKPFFTRAPSDQLFHSSDSQNLNNDCLGCHYLKKKPKNPNLNWLTHLKSKCEELSTKCGWTKSVLAFLKDIKENHSDYFVKKYIIDVYYIDYKSRIFDNISLEDNEITTHNSLKKHQNNLRAFSPRNHDYDDNSPVIQVNDDDFMLEKNPTYSKHIYLHYTDNLNKLVESNSHTHDYNLGKSLIKNPTFLQNNTMISQNKIAELEALDATTLLEKNQYIVHQNCLNHYKMVTNVIEKHLKDWKSHPLGIVKQTYLKFFLNEYKEKPQTNKNFENSILDVQQIIRLLSETVLLFYNFVEYKKYIKRFYFFSRENMLAFMTCVIFTEKNVYQTLLTYQMKEEEVIEKSIEKTIRKCVNWSPEDFGISRKYTLTEKTIEYYTFLKKNSKFTVSLNKSVSLTNFEPMKHEDEIVSFHKMESFNNDKETFDQVETIKIGQDEAPYQSCIETLKGMNNWKAPIHKLKTISKVFRLIAENIKEFYKKFNEKFEEKCIEPDEVISIFMFIVTKAHIDGLYSQCVLMERFLTAQVLSSVSAYHLTHLKAALFLLSKFDEKTKK